MEDVKRENAIQKIIEEAMERLIERSILYRNAVKEPHPIFIAYYQTKSRRVGGERIG